VTFCWIIFARPTLRKSRSPKLRELPNIEKLDCEFDLFGDNAKVEIPRKGIRDEQKIFTGD
jgi:hypothetical protein